MKVKVEFPVTSIIRHTFNDIPEMDRVDLREYVIQLIDEQFKELKPSENEDWDIENLNIKVIK